MKRAPLLLYGDPARTPPDSPPGPVDVVVPVAGAPDAFARCLDSLRAHTDLERDRLVVVLDGPQPAPTLERLERLQREHPRGAVVLENAERRGFVAAVNRGMSASDRDIILLNSDTQVTARWVAKLQAAAYSAPEIATVTPFSNSATPPRRGTPAGGVRRARRLDRALDRPRIVRPGRARSHAPRRAGAGERPRRVAGDLRGRGGVRCSLRSGGPVVVAHLLLRRIEGERGPIALLYPESAGWRLDIQAGDQRRSIRFPGSPLSPTALEDASFERAVRAAAETLGAGTLYVDGLAGLPPGSLRHLQEQGLKLILSLHDFAVFCPRPHLLEKPQLCFCWYSRDLVRCGHCLRQDWPVEDRFQRERREIGAELLAGATALVFPSEFLRRAHQDLFPDLEPERQRIVAPAGAQAVPLPGRPTGSVRRVALVGGVQAHKGALVFEEVVKQMEGEDLRWTSYGGGDAELPARLRRLRRIRVRGYYRAGSLPRLLRRDAVDLALLLSIVPESYSLVLDECLSAGVPVLAFALGAVGDRLPQLGAEELVSLEAGAEGIVRALKTRLDR